MEAGFSQIHPSYSSTKNFYILCTLKCMVHQLPYYANWLATRTKIQKATPLAPFKNDKC